MQVRVPSYNARSSGTSSLRAPSLTCEKQECLRHRCAATDAEPTSELALPVGVVDLASPIGVVNLNLASWHTAPCQRSKVNSKPTK